MKRKILTLTLSLCTIFIVAQTTNIPDANFENYLETHSKIDLSIVNVGDVNSMGNGIAGDHLVTTANISSRTSIYLNSLGISDLTGIQDFTSLTDLYCADNNITALILPSVTSFANLFIDRNKITSISFPDSLTSIGEFMFQNNDVNSINLNNVNYINYFIGDHNDLTTLDLSNTDVEGLNCSSNPNLESIDLRNGADYSEIYEFRVKYNPKLTCIYVDNLVSVSTILNNGVDSNTDFVTDEAMCNLVSNYTYVPDNNFEQALIDEGLDDVLDDYVLTTNINSVTFLDVSNKNIADLTGIEDFIELETFGCDNNQLTTLDLSNNHILEFGCGNNQLTSLILNADARVVFCGNNLLTSLNVPSGIANLDCSNNNIVSLDLSNTTELSILNVSNNNLDFLDFRNGENGQISSSYDYRTGYEYSFDASNNPDLKCIFVDDASFSTTNWKKVDATSHFVENQTQCDAATIEYTYIPDDNFEQVLIDAQLDDVLDDYVLTDNIKNLTFLNISFKNISDLTGIEDFVSLKSLACTDNSLTSLDVTKNTALSYLSFSFNQITTIDVSKNVALETLVAVHNQLSGLNVTNNVNLKKIECWSNNISNIDLSKNLLLEELDLNNNTLTSLDITQNINLKKVVFGGIESARNTISSLDVSKNINLTELTFVNTQIATIDVSSLINLTNLMVHHNQLVDIDVSLNSALKDLVCYNNQLKTLNVKNGNNTNFIRFEAHNNPFLNCIQVDDPSWSNTNWLVIDNWATFGDNCHYYETYVPDDNFEQALINLGYDSGSLDDYVLTNNINTVTNLVIINKGISDITGLEDFDALSYFDCSYNALTTLATYYNEELSVLRCNNNQLTSLDIMGNVNLVQIFCGDNNLTSLDYLYYAPDLNFISIENNQISNLELGANRELLNLFVDGNNLTSLEVNNNSKLTVLSCNNNKITNLDVSNNPDIFYLYASNNQLTDLDVSNNPDLLRLSLRSNQLTSLDVRNGSNTQISNGTFNTINNPNLTCIYVDSVNWSIKNWTNIDATSNFVADETACNALDVDSFIFDGFKILSNPATENINLLIEEEANFILVDINGKILKKGKLTIGSNAIKVSNVAKGLCFLKVTNSYKNTVAKIIIK